MRSAIFGTVGLVYIGPMLHLNYSKILPTLVPECAKTAAWMMASKKLLFDQLIFAPICTSGFFITINLLECNGLQKGVNDVKDKLWRSMLVNWQLWVPANFLNFCFVPMQASTLYFVDLSTMLTKAWSST